MDQTKFNLIKIITIDQIKVNLINFIKIIIKDQKKYHVNIINYYFK